MSPLDAQSRPALARGVRLMIDPVTGGPVLLFPEGVLPLDDATHDIVSRCSGDSTLEAIVLSLAGEYEAEQDVLRNDVCECLEQLREEMLITVPT
jgi:pyrroloquinoline quinone biosynthesis protein D